MDNEFNDGCKDCGMCNHFMNGDDHDYCDATGEPRECYEEICDDFDDTEDFNEEAAAW